MEDPNKKEFQSILKDDDPVEVQHQQTIVTNTKD